MFKKIIYQNRDSWPYSESKLDLSSKKIELSSDAKIFVFLYICALKAILQVLKFKFCQIKSG